MLASRRVTSGSVKLAKGKATGLNEGISTSGSVRTPWIVVVLLLPACRIRWVVKPVVPLGRVMSPLGGSENRCDSLDENRTMRVSFSWIIYIHWFGAIWCQMVGKKADLTNWQASDLPMKS